MEKIAGLRSIASPDGGPVQALLKVRHGIRLPCRSISRPEHHGPLVRQVPPTPPASKRHETGTLPGSSRASSRVVRVPAPPTLPSLPISPNKPSSARIASRPAACHAVSLIKAYARRIRLFIAERPFPSFQSYSSAPEASTRTKENTPPLFTPQPPPSLLSGRMACLISNSRRQRRGLSPRPEESFFRDGESTRGEGAVFTKNTPSPLVIPLLHSPSPTKKAGQSPAPAFTGKTKEQ